MDGICLQVRAQLKEHSILLYDVGGAEDQPPYAVVSSNTLTSLEDGRRVRGREYPWGTLNIEDKVGFVPSKRFVSCLILHNNIITNHERRQLLYVLG